MASPAMRGVSPAADDILAAAPQEVLVQATTELDTTRLSTENISLIRSGLDGSFEEGNEVTMKPLRIEVRSMRPTVLAVVLPKNQWVPDSYQLTIAGAGPAPVTDLMGRAINGEGNGTVGSDFVMHFEIGGTL
jgi:hypothetical protein